MHLFWKIKIIFDKNISKDWEFQNKIQARKSIFWNHYNTVSHFFDEQCYDMRYLRKEYEIIIINDYVIYLPEPTFELLPWEKEVLEEEKAKKEGISIAVQVMTKIIVDTVEYYWHVESILSDKYWSFWDKLIEKIPFFYYVRKAITIVKKQVWYRTKWYTKSFIKFLTIGLFYKYTTRPIYVYIYEPISTYIKDLFEAPYCIYKKYEFRIVFFWFSVFIAYLYYLNLTQDLITFEKPFIAPPLEVHFVIDWDWIRQNCVDVNSTILDPSDELDSSDELKEELKEVLKEELKEESEEELNPTKPPFYNNWGFVNLTRRPYFSSCLIKYFFDKINQDHVIPGLGLNSEFQKELYKFYKCYEKYTVKHYNKKNPNDKLKNYNFNIGDMYMHWMNYAHLMERSYNPIVWPRGGGIGYDDTDVTLTDHAYLTASFHPRLHKKYHKLHRGGNMIWPIEGFAHDYTPQSKYFSILGYYFITNSFVTSGEGQEVFKKRILKIILEFLDEVVDCYSNPKACNYRFPEKRWSHRPFIWFPMKNYADVFEKWANDKYPNLLPFTLKQNITKYDFAFFINTLAFVKTPPDIRDSGTCNISRSREEISTVLVDLFLRSMYKNGVLLPNLDDLLNFGVEKQKVAIYLKILSAKERGLKFEDVAAWITFKHTDVSDALIQRARIFSFADISFSWAFTERFFRRRQLFYHLRPHIDRKTNFSCFWYDIFGAAKFVIGDPCRVKYLRKSFEHINWRSRIPLKFLLKFNEDLSDRKVTYGPFNKTFNFSRFMREKATEEELKGAPRWRMFDEKTTREALIKATEEELKGAPRWRMFDEKTTREALIKYKEEAITRLHAHKAAAILRRRSHYKATYKLSRAPFGYALYVGKMARTRLEEDRVIWTSLTHPRGEIKKRYILDNYVARWLYFRSHRLFKTLDTRITLKSIGSTSRRYTDILCLLESEARYDSKFVYTFWNWNKLYKQGINQEYQLTMSRLLVRRFIKTRLEFAKFEKKNYRAKCNRLKLRI